MHPQMKNADLQVIHFEKKAIYFIIITLMKNLI